MKRAEIQPPAGLLRALVAATGYFRARTWLAAGKQAIPGMKFYQPLYSPWLGEEPFETLYRAVRPHTLVSRDRCFVLWRTLLQARHLSGDVIECGVFRGGTALLAARTLAGENPPPALHLFDSFQGMPGDVARHEHFAPGDFDRTSVRQVENLLSAYPAARMHVGFIPETFAGLEVPAIAWAHVDVDLHQSVRDCIDWIYPRLSAGGYIVFDDYGFPSCSGARRAVDEAFADKPESPLCLPTGQCLVVKLAAGGERS
jgi:O-methyltransferase